MDQDCRTINMSVDDIGIRCYTYIYYVLEMIHMNNEDKILALLVKMQSDMASMQNDISCLKSDVTTMKSDITSMKSDICVLNKGQSNLETELCFIKDRVIVMEHEHGHKLDVILDAQTATDEEIKDLRLRVLRLEQCAK